MPSGGKAKARDAAERAPPPPGIGRRGGRGQPGASPRRTRLPWEKKRCPHPSRRAGRRWPQAPRCSRERRRPRKRPPRRKPRPEPGRTDAAHRPAAAAQRRRSRAGLLARAPRPPRARLCAGSGARLLSRLRRADRARRADRPPRGLRPSGRRQDQADGARRDLPHGLHDQAGHLGRRHDAGRGRADEAFRPDHQLDARTPRPQGRAPARGAGRGGGGARPPDHRAGPAAPHLRLRVRRERALRAHQEALRATATSKPAPAPSPATRC